MSVLRVLYDRLTGEETRRCEAAMESDAAHLADLLAHACEHGLSCVGGCEACEDIRARVPVPAAWREAS
jgi:uncharacterized protein (DUF2267 family)